MKFMRDSTRKKRKFVMDVALNLFAKHGYDAVSVDDIIEKTGISKGTFYHYFSGKDEIVLDMCVRQSEVVREWNERTPSQVRSLEGHVNKLFLDLAARLKDSPLLVRTLFALTLQNESFRARHEEHLRYLRKCLMRWLPDEKKAEMLVNAYTGVLMIWSLDGNADLEDMMKRRLYTLWEGLRYSGPEKVLAVEEPPAGEAARMTVAVIGGGLAGLTAAAYLSESPSVKGILLERSPQLGGRAFTYEKSGFTLNYGAHAIYGIDRHTVSDLQSELGLSFGSNQVDKRKVMYKKDDHIAPAPLDFVNLVKTELLNTRQKVRFVGEIGAIMANIHKLKQFPTLGDYLAESGVDDTVKELWEHLVCSNFFISPEDARKVPGAVIGDYYHNLFRSSRPVNYILGSWAVLTHQLKQKAEVSGRWEISVREAVEDIRFEAGKFRLKTKKREIEADRVVFAMPVQQVLKLLKDTPWEPFLAPYARNTPTEVLVYDVGLSRVVARPFSYISDMNRKMFISDVSATDSTLVPEGGQLLQGIAYIHDDEIDDEDERKAYLDERMQQMESLFDRHYPGWRDAVEVKRMSRKAMVQSVKSIVGNRMLPVRIDSVPFYFCGDGCEGKGQLAERAFSSAREAARRILAEI